MTRQILIYALTTVSGVATCIAIGGSDFDRQGVTAGIAVTTALIAIVTPLLRLTEHTNKSESK